jgi:hypothetical protein
VQLRHPTSLTSNDYVTRQAWREASLDRCPAHPRGGCGFRRNGSYARVEPPGMRVARCYCPTAQTTWSLLPDCLASRLSSDLAEVEQVVTRVAAGPSIEAAAAAVRPDITLPSAVRWVQRRVLPVRAALLALVTLMPSQFAGCSPTVAAVTAVVGTTPALVRLREIGAPHLAALPPPLGFGPRRRPWQRWGRRCQHDPGADPPVPGA